VETFANAANSILIVRLLPVIIGFATLLVVGTIEEKITGKKENNISIYIMIGIIPFYNTIGQVRGYGLSLLLVCVVFYYGYSFYQNPKKLKGFLTALFTALLLYTIPSNLYAVLSALVILGVIFLRQWYKYHFLIAVKFNAIKLIGWLLLGIGMAVLLYLPMGSQVVNNEYVKAKGFFRWEIWGEAKQIFQFIFMPFYIIPILVGLDLIVASIKKADVRLITALAVFVTLPFVFSFIRGGQPFDRTFLWIVPFVALITALASNIAYKKWLIKPMYGNEYTFKILVFLVVIYSVGSAQSNIKEKLHSGLEKGVKYQNIYYNYYLGRYNPHQNLGLLKENYYQEGTQVFLHEVDKRAMPAYLSVHDLKWQPYKDTIPKIDEYYIVTAFEQQAIKEYKQVDSAFTFKRLNKERDFVNIIQAKRTK
jgi:hypothetical protein